ncbi:MAG: gephyrin-like molybdotransferase Glp [Pseudomonadota bacterium]
MSTRQTSDPCHQPTGLLQVEEARRRILAALVPVAGREQVDLRHALDRVLDEPIVADQPVPGHDNSAMDGYALRHADLASNGNLRLVGRAMAGAPFGGRIDSGEVVRIMTGAVVPEGADTVVMQEQVVIDGETVTVGPDHRLGENIRRAGEDLAPGDEVLAPGRRLTPADLGLIASLGRAEVAVRRRPRVAFFSTGDELRRVDEPLGPGEIHDSNRYLLHGLLSESGVEFIDGGIIEDDLAAIEDTLRDAAAMADLVITSGGASVGDADHIHTALERQGEVAFWRIAMKPGKPLAFGHVGKTAFFGLPGNPVSAMATFLQFVRPALAVLGGEPASAPATLPAVTAEPFRKTPGRTDFQRGCLEHDADGRLRVRPTGSQGSHILRSMSLADCLVILPAESGDLDAGVPVMVQPLRPLRTPL